MMARREGIGAEDRDWFIRGAGSSVELSRFRGASAPCVEARPSAAGAGAALWCEVRALAPERWPAPARSAAIRRARRRSPRGLSFRHPAAGRGCRRPPSRWGSAGAPRDVGEPIGRRRPAPATVIGLFKTAIIRRRGPWRGIEGIRFATLEWVDWFNNHRPLEPTGKIPPAEAEARYRAVQMECARAFPTRISGTAARMALHPEAPCGRCPPPTSSRRIHAWARTAPPPARPLRQHRPPRRNLAPRPGHRTGDQASGRSS